MKRTKRLIISLFSVLLMVSLLLGCQTEPSEPPGRTPATVPPSAPAPTPMPTKPYDQELVVLTDGAIAENYLPHLNGMIDFALWDGVGEYLLRRDPDTGKILPGLAKSFEVSGDFMTYTFHLQQGVQWHKDWGEFTAEDVKFTFDDLMSREDASNSQAKTFTTITKEIEIKDPYTVVWHLNDPNWELPEVLTNYPQFAQIASKKYVEEVGIEEANQKPIGTGPYQFVERRAGDYIKLEAVPNHWRQTADFKFVTIRLVPELSTRIAMLKAGEADIVPIPAERKDELEGNGYKTVVNPGARLYWVNFGGMYLLERDSFDPSLPWWADPADTVAWENAKKVREAMTLAVNVNEINDVIFGGTADLFEAPHIWPFFAAQDPAWKPYPYDLDKAKQLLAEAGYPNGFDVTMLITSHGGRPENQDLGEAVATYWEALGLNVKRIPMDFGTLRPKLSAREVKEAWIYGLPYLEATSSIYRNNSAYRGWGMAFEYMPSEELSDKAYAEVNEEKRTELTREWGQLSIDNYFVLPLAGSSRIWAMSDRVGEFPATPGNGYDIQSLEYTTYQP